MSLSDKISSGIADSTRDDLLIIEKLPFDVIKVKDVKSAVQELKKWLCESGYDWTTEQYGGKFLWEGVTEIFGEKLSG